MRGPPSSHSNTSNSSTNSSTKSGGSLGPGVAGGRGTGMPGAAGAGGAPNAMSKRMIKDSDKSSGTNNLVGTGGGSSTLTGKNPFAILKASSIAAS